MTRTWSAVLARIGTPTGDKRIIAPGALTSRELPLPLMWQRVSDAGHSGSVTVGAITSMAIDNESGMVTAEGTFLPVRGAAEAQRQTEAGVTGPSVDLFDDVDIMEVQTLIEAGVVGPNLLDNMDDIEYAMDDDGMIVITRARIAGATLVQIPAFAGVSISIADRDEDEDDPMYGLAASAGAFSVRTSGWSGMPIADPGHAWDGSGAADRVFAWAGGPDSVSWSKYARAFLRKDDDANPETRGAYGFGIADIIDGALTIVPRGVFAAAAAVQGARTGKTPEDADAMKSVLRGIYKRMDREAPFSLAASAASVLPPLDWFRQPDLDQLTPLTVCNPNTLGYQRVFGHIAGKETCHVGLPGCVTAPSSASGYAYFHTAEQMTEEGILLPVGTIVAGPRHADPQLAFQAASQHYDDPSAAVARVMAGEDEHGIWVAGWILPQASPQAVEIFRSSPVSGDWRRIGGDLEMIAVCSVNAPGFPIPRARVAFSNGAQRALIASAGIRPQEGEYTKTGWTRRADVAAARLRDARARMRWALTGMEA